jgi:prevent-host-death family protein
MIINSSEFQNNVGRFLKQVIDEDIVITKNGKEIARLISSDRTVSFLADSLVGLLPNNFNTETAKQNYFEEKYNLKI